MLKVQNTIQAQNNALWYHEYIYKTWKLKINSFK